MDEDGEDQARQRDDDLSSDPFSCGLITVLLLLGATIWLGFVYVLSRGW